MSSATESLYDYPLYYDILFGWDRSRETAFYDAAFKHYGGFSSGRVLEIACGTAQVGRRLAALGWRVSGLDLNPEMLAFLAAAARRDNVSVEGICGDMTDFRVPSPLDAAFCPLGSICILKDDASFLAHLESMANALKPGGVYIIDLGLAGAPGPAVETSFETWSMTRGPIEVAALGDTISVRDPALPGPLTLNWGGGLRRYTTAQFTDLIHRSSDFSPLAWHPESPRAESELSVFDLDRHAPNPAPGRGMLVLKRR